jgi:hypothetical protein
MGKRFDLVASIAETLIFVSRSWQGLYCQDEVINHELQIKRLYSPPK